MRPDPHRRAPQLTSKSRRPPLDTTAADLAALRAVATLAQSHHTVAGSDPPTGHVADRWTAVLDLLDTHLAGGRAHRAVIKCTAWLAPRPGTVVGERPRARHQSVHATGVGELGGSPDWAKRAAGLTRSTAAAIRTSSSTSTWCARLRQPPHHRLLPRPPHPRLLPRTRQPGPGGADVGAPPVGHSPLAAASRAAADPAVTRRSFVGVGRGAVCPGRARPLALGPVPGDPRAGLRRGRWVVVAGAAAGSAHERAGSLGVGALRR